MTKVKCAIYLGGPLDGQRHTVRELPRDQRVAFLESIGKYEFLDGKVTGLTARANHALYVMASPPFTPAAHPLAQPRHASLTETGIYYFMGVQL